MGSQVFTVVNDEAYYYPDLFKGMIVAGDFGDDMAIYTGSTTGTSRSNDLCSQYSPITWQVDRKCHPRRRRSTSCAPTWPRRSTTCRPTSTRTARASSPPRRWSPRRRLTSKHRFVSLLRSFARRLGSFARRRVRDL